MGLSSHSHHKHKGGLFRKPFKYINEHVAPTLRQASKITTPLSKGVIALGTITEGVGILTGQPELIPIGAAMKVGGSVGLGLSTVMDETAEASKKSAKGEDATKNIQKATTVSKDLYANHGDDIFKLFI